MAGNLEAELEKYKAGAMCDACMGAPGKVTCMCGGTGMASDAVTYLRKQLIEEKETVKYMEEAFRRLFRLASDSKGGRYPRVALQWINEVCTDVFKKLEE